MLVVGIAGQICSGKRTAAQLLSQRLGIGHISLGSIARTEYGLSRSARARRRAITEYANGRREAEGVDHFLRRALAQCAEEDGVRGLIVSGISCVGEARYLLENLGGVLVTVGTSSPAVRWDRLLARNDDSSELLTREQFDIAERHESAGIHDHEMNVAAVTQLAGVYVSNDFAIEQLRDCLEDFATSLVLTLDEPRERTQDCPPVLKGVVGGLNSPKKESRVDDSLGDNLELERNRAAFDFLQRSYSLIDLTERERALAPLMSSQHAVPDIGNQFARKLTQAFMEPIASKALTMFREIRPSTLDEELATLLNDTEFLQRHAGLHQYLVDQRDALNDAAVRNLQEAERNDSRQFAVAEVRSTEAASEQGVVLRISRAGRPLIEQARQQAGQGMFPVLELVKNSRVLEVSGFEGSKVSHSIHDMIDHVWLFDLLRRRGTFEHYADLFDSIGNPEAFDIFRREGEVVASIGFGVRLWANTQVGFVPEVSLSDMLQRMEADFDAGLVGDLHRAAFVRLRSLARDLTGRESQSLAFVYSNYLAELDEQRRKAGRIKVRDRKSHRVVGELDPWSPDYLAFFVDTHSLLLDSHNKHRDTLLRVHLIVEEFLCSDAALDGQPLQLTLQSLANRDFSATLLPPTRIEWMARNYGFSAIREPVI